MNKDKALHGYGYTETRIEEQLDREEDNLKIQEAGFKGWYDWNMDEADDLMSLFYKEYN